MSPTERQIPPSIDSRPRPIMAADVQTVMVHARDALTAGELMQLLSERGWTVKISWSRERSPRERRAHARSDTGRAAKQGSK